MDAFRFREGVDSQRATSIHRRGEYPVWSVIEGVQEEQDTTESDGDLI